MHTRIVIPVAVGAFALLAGAIGVSIAQTGPPTPDLSIRPPTGTITPFPTYAPTPLADTPRGGDRPPPTRPPVQRDNTGALYLYGGDVLPASSTGRVGDWYVTAPAGADLKFGGLSIGEKGTLMVFLDTRTESGLRIDGVTGVRGGPTRGRERTR
jgi:hypothetical protein